MEVEPRNQPIGDQFMPQPCLDLVASGNMADSRSGPVRACGGKAAVNEGCNHIPITKFTYKTERSTDQRQEGNCNGMVYKRIALQSLSVIVTALILPSPR